MYENKCYRGNLEIHYLAEIIYLTIESIIGGSTLVGQRPMKLLSSICLFFCFSRLDH